MSRTVAILVLLLLGGCAETLPPPVASVQSSDPRQVPYALAPRP